MNNPIHHKNIPNDSLVAQGFGLIAYADTFEVPCQTCNSIDTIAASIFSVPSWVDILLVIRNSIVRPFGIKTDIEINRKKTHRYEVGERAVYFTVINRNDTEIIMEEHDSHLNFRVSVMLREKYSTLHLTTIVYYKNMFGKIYFSAIKPFHKIIIKRLLKRTAKSICT